MARCLVSYQRSTYAATYGGTKCVESENFVSMVSTVKNQNSRKCLEVLSNLLYINYDFRRGAQCYSILFFVSRGDLITHTQNCYWCKTFKTGFDGKHLL